ncbi:hypothetical protein P171DRAFT_483457 [Karstenula rhodostoma CBS 690.94]|uniref:Uncharacterized protein n=1 Tax=Karstenula rhodostoma CBS 690.94 TaxID=1392251 RepID=A0A9P4PJ80_9PLEO|nr:hypothetical protein P171DRAFT_483457 [Karstenula rhodostoma CBS 690.94]
MASSIPVILCGRTEAIGAGIIEALKPEIEVMHFILTPEADSALGPNKYERTSEAVLLGAGYGEEDTVEIREASKGIKDVPWLRPEYEKALVARIMEKVKGLEEKGEMRQDAVVWY